MPASAGATRRQDHARRQLAHLAEMDEAVPAQGRARGLAEEEIANAAGGEPRHGQDPASDVRELSAVAGVDETKLGEPPHRGQLIVRHGSLEKLSEVGAVQDPEIETKAARNSLDQGQDLRRERRAREEAEGRALLMGEGAR